MFWRSWGCLLTPSGQQAGGKHPTGFLVINNVIYSTIAVEGKSLSWASRVSPGPVIFQATGTAGTITFWV